MSYEFIGGLCESRLFPSAKNLTRYSAETLAELCVLYICGLYMLWCNPETERWARTYAKRTIQHDKFDRWETNGTDLYIMLHALLNKDVELDEPAQSNKFRATIPVHESQLIRWLREMGNDHISDATHNRLFARLDFNFKIKSSSLRAIRRLVMDWNELDKHDHKLAMTRTLQMIRARASRGEIIVMLNKMAAKHGLEMKGVCNAETGEGCEDEGPVVHHASPGHEPKKKSGSFLASLAGFGIGMAASNALHKSRVKEEATAGGTSAASVATVAGGLGTGFDPNGDKGIYQGAKKKKPIVLRRTPPLG